MLEKEKYFLVAGYFYDDETPFEDYIISSSNSVLDNDDDIFYYGLTEKEIKTAIRFQQVINGFIITHYMRIK